MTEATFFPDLAEGPKNADVRWLTAADGVRIRAAYWGGGAKGTVLLFPGRTEYIEKYGRAATELLARGYSTIAIDWRGQGLADRLARDRHLGHVRSFSDYQLDVNAVLDFAREVKAPQPFYLIAHSMGGCIGLRALHETLPVRAAAFSGPMWGISMSRSARPIANLVSFLGRHVIGGRRYAPSTGPRTYVSIAPFEGNSLTKDPDMYDYMRRQVTEQPTLALGGPSLWWLYEAIAETRALRRMPAPQIPAITYLGGDEQIVDPAPIYEIMAKWQNGKLEVLQGSEHEIMMETPKNRTTFFDAAAALFDANR